MLKVSYFEGQHDGVPTVIPLFGRQDPVFEKLASPYLLPEVQRYIDALRPRDNAQYVLVNAMGASEFYSSNSNGDAFKEAALIHSPDDWTGEPALDRDKAKDWAYGFPTFYNARAYAHHRNTKADRGLGDVELASWNPHMHRVELVVRVDKDRCQAFDGQATWDKLKAGHYVDVSMGTKVPFDSASCCLDVPLYKEAWSSFDPAKHKSPGEAILEFHKRLKARDGLGIRGLSITRHDYCPHAKAEMNRILPDGRKIYVDNDFPRFFDISFVFIGADKIAKVMLKIADSGRRVFVGGAELAEKLGMVEEPWLEKAAALVVTAKQKSGEINKSVVPNQLAGKAVPLMTGHEQDLPIDRLSDQPLDRALSTTAGLGMVLRPREFQQLVLRVLGEGGLSDQLDRSGQLFPATGEEESVTMGPGSFSAALARALLPSLQGRSALGPIIERRVIVLAQPANKEAAQKTAHDSPLLRKISAAYNGYRRQLLENVVSAQQMIEKVAGAHDQELHRLVGLPAEQLFTPLSFQYLKYAFLDEIPAGDSGARDVTNTCAGGRASPLSSRSLAT